MYAQQVPEYFRLQPPRKMQKISKFQYQRIFDTESQELSYSNSISDGLGASLGLASRPGAELGAELELSAAAGATEGAAVIDAKGGGQACYVCLDAAADVVLIECGHGGLCAGNASPRTIPTTSSWPLPLPFRAPPSSRARRRRQARSRLCPPPPKRPAFPTEGCP